MYACLAGARAAAGATSALEKDELVPARKRLGASKYSAELLDIVDWCLRLDHLERPQSVFALQKALLGEKEPEHAAKRRCSSSSAARCCGCKEASNCTSPRRAAHRRRAASTRTASATGRRRALLLLVVADGLGGHPDGEVAAEIAVDLLRRRVPARGARRARRPGDVPRRARSPRRTRAILREADERGLPDAPRTVLVACVVQDGHAYWAHVGDCRLYLVRQGRIAAPHARPHAWCSS